MKRSGIWLMVGLAAIGGLAGCGDGEATGAQDAEPAVAKKVVVRTEVPEPREVTDVITLAAELVAARRAVLAAETSGAVERLVVEEGQRVAAGALIAAIDTRALAQQVAEAEAVERQARAQFERAQALYEKRAITKQQMLDAVTGRDVASARLSSARLALSKSRLYAPWAGTVAVQRVEVGDFVTPGQPVVELVDDHVLNVRSPAPASDVPYLAVGMPVVVRVDAFAGESFPAHITRLGAELDPLARSLEVEAELSNRGGRLKPGMPAVMEVPRRTLAAALLVPLAAVVDLGEQRAIFVVDAGIAHRHIVELGPMIGERVVISAGLAAGERVVVEGEQRLAEGQAVEEAPVAAAGRGTGDAAVAAETSAR